MRHHSFIHIITAGEACIPREFLGGTDIFYFGSGYFRGAGSVVSLLSISTTKEFEFTIYATVDCVLGSDCISESDMRWRYYVVYLDAITKVMNSIVAGSTRWRPKTARPNR